MSKLFRDYFWKDGSPVGVGPMDQQATGYKIISDPYRKRISIEQFLSGKFEKVIYDSALFDFRHLKPAEQTAWHKQNIEESDSQVICLIRNQDDRTIIKEINKFHQGLCRECVAFSSHGIPISFQRMYYTSLNDPFNGVILFDANEHPVIVKKYNVDTSTGEFSELLEEIWNLELGIKL